MAQLVSDNSEGKDIGSRDGVKDFIRLSVQCMCGKGGGIKEPYGEDRLFEGLGLGKIQIGDEVLTRETFEKWFLTHRLASANSSGKKWHDCEDEITEAFTKDQGAAYARILERHGLASGKPKATAGEKLLVYVSCPFTTDGNKVFEPLLAQQKASNNPAMQKIIGAIEKDGGLAKVNWQIIKDELPEYKENFDFLKEYCKVDGQAISDQQAYNLAFVGIRAQASGIANALAYTMKQENRVVVTTDSLVTVPDFTADDASRVKALHPDRTVIVCGLIDSSAKAGTEQHQKSVNDFIRNAPKALTHFEGLIFDVKGLAIGGDKEKKDSEVSKDPILLMQSDGKGTVQVAAENVWSAIKESQLSKDEAKSPKNAQSIPGKS